MDSETQAYYANLFGEDGDARYAAMNYLLAATEQRVDWAYEVWDTLLTNLHHKNGHVRAIAAQLLANLAKSDPTYRMQHNFAALLAATKDEKFVTARHSLQALWKVGTAGPQQQQLVVDGLTQRFHECNTEKHYTLIRFDIMQGLQQLYVVNQDAQIKATALALIETEQDLKYRKKYATVWKGT